MRKKSVKPLVEEFFAWVKACINDTSVLPKERQRMDLIMQSIRKNTFGYFSKTAMFRSTIRFRNMCSEPSVSGEKAGC